MIKKTADGYKHIRSNTSGDLNAGVRVLTGRTKIIANVSEIDTSNLVDVLKRAFITHLKNEDEINYLFNYRKGNQPILNRIKKIRPHINNKIVENRADEIVSFNSGFICSEPIQYVTRGSDEKSVIDDINMLNDYMYSQGKASLDGKVFNDNLTCGTAYRMVLPSLDDDECPFDAIHLNPKKTFVVYDNTIRERDLFACTYSMTEDEKTLFNIYTRDMYYEVLENKIVKTQPLYLGFIPIVEYPSNEDRLGSFEVVLPLLDALNKLNSNRLDSVEQFVQSIVKFINCDISDDDSYEQMIEKGFLILKTIGSGKVTDVEIMSSTLDQSQIQTLVDYVYQTILTICGIPNRNGGSSTSDTGTAVVMRDGWDEADKRAKARELMFKESEKKFLKLVLKLSDLDLKIRNIDIKFTRRNYENIQSKSQVLISMLNNPKIHPLLAFVHCGMFSDPEDSYQKSMEHYNQQKAQLKNQEKLKDINTPDMAVDIDDREVVKTQIENNN